MWVPDSPSQVGTRRYRGFGRLHSSPRSCSDYHRVRDGSRRMRAVTREDPCRYMTVIGGEPKKVAAVGAAGV